MKVGKKSSLPIPGNTGCSHNCVRISKLCHKLKTNKHPRFENHHLLLPLKHVIP